MKRAIMIALIFICFGCSEAASRGVFFFPFFHHYHHYHYRYYRHYFHYRRSHYVQIRNHYIIIRKIVEDKNDLDGDELQLQRERLREVKEGLDKLSRELKEEKSIHSVPQY